MLLPRKLLGLKGVPNKKTPEKIVTLDAKIEAFINEYYENIKDSYPEDIAYNETVAIRNLIEKIAVWYELRYPDYIVTKLIPGTSNDNENTNVDEAMFSNNPYIKNLLEDNPDIEYLDWHEFYNYQAFLNSLPVYEYLFLAKPRYPEIVYFNPDRGGAHLHLSPDGIIEMSELVYVWSNFLVKDEELESLHLKDALKLLKSRNVELPPNNELEDKTKEGILNCAMYRIIERGGKIVGPRRALIFAKEFERDISIPMKYGVDYSDNYLRYFINEYLKAGGREDLVCYANYHDCKDKNSHLYDVTVREILDTFDYTPEELDLYERLINALSTKANAEKPLTLERNLKE
ncbi:MAG: hypothetical protein NC483_02305 [Ruminococcus sp.]|nr:hypothetical protein [Ruminococcus sp.]